MRMKNRPEGFVLTSNRTGKAVRTEFQDRRDKGNQSNRGEFEKEEDINQRYKS